MVPANAAPASAAESPRSFGDAIDQIMASPVEDEGTETAPEVPQDEAGAPDDGAEPSSPADGGDADDAQPQSPDGPESTALETPEIQTEPFTYTVDGEQRQDAAAYRVPGDGLYIPEREVPRYQQMASRAEMGERQVRDLHQQTRQLQELMAWQTPGANGQPGQTLSGIEGLGALRTVLAQTLAERTVVQEYMSDPNRLASLLAADPEGRVTANPDGLRQFQLAIENAQLRASHAVQSDWAKRTGTLSANVRQPSAGSPTVGIEQVQQAAPQIVTAVAQQTGRTLDAQTQTFLAQQLPRYVRPAADGERDPTGAFLRAGEPVLDASFTDLVKRMGAGQKPNASASTFNASQQQARRTAAPARPQSAPVAPPTPGKPKRFREVIDSLVDDPETLAMLNGTT